ncbi:hypothetical protein HBI70_059100 [Parastagonospora nodorum]|nr:hypothetical protein HBI70_059100 [Parastagonospora nodorum]KAH5326745.1 hypothetical protein HBI50_086350 [Parastagonospora nodorum]KAH5601054.1 hypothetical protein HBI45_142320 [Parastagonospora nodorum]KAH5672070.1 hypothetical protein HBI23_063480 [Parastagonospora nodorum]KAH6458143.1 hypothetical protein HBI57_103670 [Parastagonospora nodorum]
MYVQKPHQSASFLMWIASTSVSHTCGTWKVFDTGSSTSARCFCCVDVVHVEVSHVFDMIVTEHTFPVWCDRAMKHTDPFGIAVAMYAGFMSFPAIRIFERFWARSAMVCLTRVESAIARDMRW